MKKYPLKRWLMNMFPYSTAVLLCLASAISCENKTQTNSFDYRDFENAPTLSLSEVFEPIRFIPLKTDEAYNLSNIIKVCMSEDSFYLLTVNPLGIFRFALDGSLISTISVEGRAEGEYLIPTDIAYSKADNVLYVADIAKGIMKFSSDGTYLSTISTTTSYKNRQFVVSDSGSIIENVLNIIGNERDAIVELSQKGDTLHYIPNTFFFDCESPFALPNHHSLRKYADEILFNPACRDTIYSYRAGRLTPKYSFFFPHSVTKEDLRDFNSNVSDTQFIVEYAEDNKNLYLSIFDRSWDYKHFVLKKTDGIIYKGDFRLSDSFGTEFSPRWQCEGWLIDVLDPSTINYAYYRDITDEARLKAYTYLSSVGVDGITAESDPIIMLAKTKKLF